MAKKTSRFLMRQKFAVGALLLVALAILAYLSWLTTRDTPSGGFVKGEHYSVIDSPRRIRGDRVEVMEFFNYACAHCYNFEPLITDWAEGREDIRLVQTPAVGSEYWRLLGRHYYTLKQLDALENHHIRFFRAIHETRQTFNGSERLFDFAESSGIDREAYRRAWNSAEVSNALNRADQMARRLKIAAVPSVVVQGKYLVRTSSTVGPRRMLDVMDYLVSRELAGRSE